MYTVRVTASGRFYIGHPQHPGLAFSHEAGNWVPKGTSFDDRTWPPTTFDTEQQADDYATDYYLYPRRD